MTGRKYSEAEVAEIFQRASEMQQGTRAPLASRDGMTLEALQQIGGEVGLTPDLIADAARSLDREGSHGTSRFLGLPLGVHRTVHLERKVTGAEWEALVVDLRQTFDARGKLRDEGAFRSWNNGNLQAMLEPMGDTDRVRLKTLNGGARSLMITGLALLGAGALFGLAGVMSGIPQTDVLERFAGLGIVGAALFTVGAVRLPAWAAARRRQMEAITKRLTGRGDPSV